MKKIYLIAFVFLSLKSFAQNKQEKIDLFENNLNHWDKTKDRKWSLKERMAFLGVNGVSIVVIKDYKVEWIKAYGYADVAENRKATPETLFQAASISKSLNSLAVLNLVEAGKLGLNDDINNYLKTWKFPYDSLSKGKKISIANLLNHRAGLSIGGFPGYAQGAELPSTEQILDGIKPANTQAVRSIFAPDTKYEYSGGGTTITQLIVENTTGQKYEDYLYSQVLMPLGMTSSSFLQGPIKTPKHLLATGYLGEQEVKGKYHIYPEKAAAGLWTNPKDLAKYLIETQKSIAGQSNKILSKEMSILRVNNQLGIFTNDYNGVKYFNHSGGNEGFVCYYEGSFEGGNGIVVMTNGRNFNLIEDMVHSIASLYAWKNYPLVSSKEPIALTIRKATLQNVDQGIAMYQKLKLEKPDNYNFSSENELNQLGYELLRSNQLPSAVKIFSLNINQFPLSANVYDSRGEAYFNLKEYELSKADYLKVLSLDPNHQNAKDMLLKIKTIQEK